MTAQSRGSVKVLVHVENFEATQWDNEPVNREPDKCLRLTWFTVHDLPEDLIPYPAAGLSGYLEGDLGVTLHGWADDAAADWPN